MAQGLFSSAAPAAAAAAATAAAAAAEGHSSGRSGSGHLDPVVVKKEGACWHTVIDQALALAVDKANFLHGPQ